MFDFNIIGKRIKSYRLKSCITQEVLSERLNISTEHLSRIESGKYKMSYSLAEQICKEFNISEAELYFGVTSDKTNSNIITLYNTLNEKQKQIIDSLIEEFTK